MSTSGSRLTSAQRAPIQPNRVRRIEGSFAFLPHQFLRAGFFASLSKDELALYVFLVLAADRNGISFYHVDRICSILEITVDDYIDARNGLIDKDLLAFDGSRFQVLSLPDKPRMEPRPALRTQDDLQTHDPATIRQMIQQSCPGRQRG
jgi:hypothetical protein